MTNLIEILNLEKKFEDHLALDKVTFNIPKGKIFGLLGPNGAGKTTLIRIITSILRQDSGTINFAGRELQDLDTENIGYMAEERGLYKKMKVKEILLYLIQLKGVPFKKAKKAISFWLGKFEIQDWENKKIEELSKGMQQKIQFISTVAHQPDLLILDEPFSGLDPVNTNLIKNEILNLSKTGTTIIFSTHRMEQVEELAENIVLINKGKIILEGNTSKIREDFKKNNFKIEFIGELDFSKISNLEILEKTNSDALVFIEDSSKTNDILAQIMNQGAKIISFNEILPTINDIFIKLVETANE